LGASPGFGRLKADVELALGPDAAVLGPEASPAGLGWPKGVPPKSEEAPVLGAAEVAAGVVGFAPNKPVPPKALPVPPAGVDEPVPVVGPAVF
jgi:hypothetical protein